MSQGGRTSRFDRGIANDRNRRTATNVPRKQMAGFASSSVRRLGVIRYAEPTYAGGEGPPWRQAHLVAGFSIGLHPAELPVRRYVFSPAKFEGGSCVDGACGARGKLV